MHGREVQHESFASSDAIQGFEYVIGGSRGTINPDVEVAGVVPRADEHGQVTLWVHPRVLEHVAGRRPHGSPEDQTRERFAHPRSCRQEVCRANVIWPHASDLGPLRHVGVGE